MGTANTISIDLPAGMLHSGGKHTIFLFTPEIPECTGCSLNPLESYRA